MRSGPDGPTIVQAVCCDAPAALEPPVHATATETASAAVASDLSPYMDASSNGRLPMGAGAATLGDGTHPPLTGVSPAPAATAR
jgi:hypothetical protein